MMLGERGFPRIEELPTLEPLVHGVDFSTDPPLVACPACGPDGESYCHPSAVIVWPLTCEGHGVEITGRGVLFFHQPQGEPLHTRGVIIVTRYDCEFGHHFEERRQFHKGGTFQEVAEIGCTCHSVDTIWRD